jgi:outer membrane protein assembly factor BamB
MHRSSRVLGRSGVRLVLAGCAALLLAGCDTFLGSPEEPPLPGERVLVLRLDRTLVADPAIADLRVRLPQPYENAAWPQPGGDATHAMHHLALAENLSVLWTADAGEAASDDQRLLSEPIVSDGRVYAMDAASVVSAFDAESGDRLWRVDLTPEDEDDDLFGGGIAAHGDRIFVTTPFARVFALDATSGEVAWESAAPAPMRSAPTVSDGRVFVLTIDNQLLALAADDGRRLWTHAAVSESAGLLGGAAPAVIGNTVIAAYSSGELFALRAETGRVLWNENLAGLQRSDALSTLADIRGRPVADRDLVIAISHSGLLSAIDLRRGSRIWDRDIGGSQSPWVAGDFVYVVDNNGELICLTRRDGRIRWIQSLPKWEDEEDQEDPIYWAGPVLAGDRLIVVGTAGQALSISPYTGDILGAIDLPSGAHLPPVVAGGTLIFLSDDARLVALR